MGFEDQKVKPTFKNPETKMGQNFEKKFTQNMRKEHIPAEYLKEIDSQLNEKEESLKKKIFQLDKMEALVHGDNQLSGIYNEMAEDGGEKYGYHYNETIMNLIFNEYVMNNAKFLQKYKMAIPKEKKRRDKSGINQLQRAGQVDQKRQEVKKKLETPHFKAEGEIHNNSLPGTMEEETSGNFGITSGMGFDINRDGVNRTEKSYNTMKEPIKEADSNEYLEITTPIGSEDDKLFVGIVNQGIDSHLEGFTKSKFDVEDRGNGKRRIFNFHTSEIPILIRRLEDESSEEAEMWARDIQDEVSGGMEETTGAASSGAFAPAFGIQRRKIGESEEEEETIDETSTSASSGQYSGLFGTERNKKLNQPIWVGGEIIGESNYLTDPSGFKQYIKEMNEFENIPHNPTMTEDSGFSSDKLKGVDTQMLGQLFVDLLAVMQKNPAASKLMGTKDDVAMIKNTIENRPDKETLSPQAQQALQSGSWLKRFFGMGEGEENPQDQQTLQSLSGELAQDGVQLNVDEKAESKSQQKFMGMVHATQKGEMPDASGAVAKAAKEMKPDDVEDFASTKHKGLPEKVPADEGMGESIIDQPSVDGRDSTTMKMKSDGMGMGGNPTISSIDGMGGMGDMDLGEGVEIEEDIATRIQCKRNEEPVTGVPINQEGGCKKKTTQQDKDDVEKNPHNLKARRKRMAKYEKELEIKKSAYSKELEKNKNVMDKLKGKKKVTEDKKPSTLIMKDRLGKENKANFKADLNHSTIKDVIDMQDEMMAKDQVEEVPANPYELAQKIEKEHLASNDGLAFKNVGDATNDKGDEIPKRNMTNPEQEEVDLIRKTQADWNFDNKPSERFEKRLKKDMGEDIYKLRQKKFDYQADAPMYNKDTEPIEDGIEKDQFNKNKSKWNRRDGIGESMITGKYQDVFGNTKFINFKLIETKEVEKPCDGCVLIDLDGLGNAYTTRVHENVEMRSIMDSFKFYMEGKKITRVKTGKQTLTESNETNAKPIINEEVKKMRKLMGYDPSKHVNTDNVKKNRNF